jgi:hypothetical protein
MKKTFLFTCIVAALFCIVEVTAQGQQPNRQVLGNDFWERRNKFIGAEIGLTPDEATKFFAIENEFRQKIFEVGRACRSLTRESQQNKKMSDADYLKLIDCYLDSRLKEAQLEKEYYEKFKKVITPEKLYKYHEADAKFSRELINMRRESMPDRNNPNRENRSTTNRPPAPRNNPVRP